MKDSARRVWFALGFLLLLTLTLYVSLLIGPRVQLDQETLDLVPAASFSPLLFGVLFGLALALMGALNYRFAPLEWLPALLLCALLWLQSGTPWGFSPYPERRAQLSRLIPVFTGIGLIEAAEGLLRKKTFRFLPKAAALLCGLALLAACCEWLYDGLYTLRIASPAHRTSLSLLAMYVLVPLARCLSGFALAPLFSRSQTAGICLIALGTLGVALQLAQWGAAISGIEGLAFAPAPINWIVYDLRMLPLHASLLFGGLWGCRREKKPG